MNTIEELAVDIARRWDGHSTARNLVRQYSEEIGLPCWFTGFPGIPSDELLFMDNVDELIETVQEEMYGEACEQIPVSSFGRGRVVWA